MIGSNNMLNNKVIYKKPSVKSAKFCSACNIKNNLCCKRLKWFTSFTTKKKKTLKINFQKHSKSNKYYLDKHLKIDLHCETDSHGDWMFLEVDFKT